MKWLIKHCSFGFIPKMLEAVGENCKFSPLDQGFINPFFFFIFNFCQLQNAHRKFLNPILHKIFLYLFPQEPEINYHLAFCNLY